MGWGLGTPAARPYPKPWQIHKLTPRVLDPWKPEMRSGAREESDSRAWLNTPTMYTRVIAIGLKKEKKKHRKTSDYFFFFFRISFFQMIAHSTHFMYIEQVAQE